MKLNFIERLYVNSPIRYGLQSLVFQWFKNTLRLNPAGRILEIGCGRGIGARMILKNFTPQQLCLMDLDQNMIEKAQSTVSANGHTRIVDDAVDSDVVDRIG